MLLGHIKIIHIHVHKNTYRRILFAVLLIITPHWKQPEVLFAQSGSTLCDPMDCSPPGSSVLGNSQARTLEWTAIFFSRGSSWPRDQTWISCIAGRFFTIRGTRKAHRNNPKGLPIRKV